VTAREKASKRRRPISPTKAADMPMERDAIEKLIKDGIPDATIEITDLAGDKDHYAAVVISAAFAGKTKLQQHRIVYQALGDHMGNALHALQLTTFAPS
jgi:stress-induced morphogen